MDCRNCIKTDVCGYKDTFEGIKLSIEKSIAYKEVERGLLTIDIKCNRFATGQMIRSGFPQSSLLANANTNTRQTVTVHKAEYKGKGEFDE